MKTFEALARDAAQSFGLDEALICALIDVESSWSPWAWNPEPRFRWLWNVKTNQPFRKLSFGEAELKSPPVDFPTLAGDRDQEWWGQQASWGLMQVMGAVARERGYPQPYLTALLEPGTNLEIGCRHFRHLLDRAVGDTARALLRWNGGGDPGYPDKVLARVVAYR